VQPHGVWVKRHRHLRAGRGSFAAMTLSTDIADFRRRDMTFAGKTRTVLTTGAIGPAIARRTPDRPLRRGICVCGLVLAGYLVVNAAG